MATYNGHNEDSSGNILLSIGNGMTATVETGTTASQAYTKGSYLFFNNRLCKATSAISSGATLAIGTNLSQTSIGQEITSHLRSSDGKEFYFDVKDGTYGYYPSAEKTASEFVPFGGTPFLADNELFVISHDERTENTYFSTYTRGTSKTITAAGNSAMIINTTQCSSMAISNSKNYSMVAMGMASDRTVTLIGYSSSFSNVDISAYDYVTISGGGYYTLTLS